MLRWLAFVIGVALLYQILGPTAVAAPTLQLPWPTGNQHRIVGGVDQYGNHYGGYSYNCGGHTGSNAFAIDFEFSIGQTVAVVAAGTVVEAVDNNLNNGGRGNYLTVDHGGGFVSRYLHLRQKTQSVPTFPAGIAPGVYVSQGQLGAYSGNTPAPGTAAHLHFDLKLNGSAHVPEPMSGVWDFGSFGLCPGVASAYWTSSPPFSSNVLADRSFEAGSVCDQPNCVWHRISPPGVATQWSLLQSFPYAYNATWFLRIQSQYAPGGSIYQDIGNIYPSAGDSYVFSSTCALRAAPA